MQHNPIIVCPIRGALSAPHFARDNVTVSEEARRVDCIKYLLKKGYPKQNFQCETVILKRIGHEGRNSLRADIVIYERPYAEVKNLPEEDRLCLIMLLAEIKRESKSTRKAINFQLEPALRLINRSNLLGVYWDDVNRHLYIKTHTENRVEISKDELGNIPQFGEEYRYKKLKYKNLIKPEDISATLMDIANILRSNQINDESTRYRETVRLLLAKYIDEREAKESGADLILQVVPGGDPSFLSRVGKLYKRASRIYSKATSIFAKDSSELDEKPLREIVTKIQGLNLLDSSSDSMQQVFMTFVPAVFKKDLDQYFTPLTLVNCMVEVLNPGPNDKIADPAMGTADFLTATMQFRFEKGDGQIINRVYGSDKDKQAYELAVINMILNKDGQTNLHNEDSIAATSLWSEQMDIALCNPPFGSRTIETRADILRKYDLAHVWIYENGLWKKTEELMPSQQLGILFIERCFKLLADGGRLGIILPEGYLCTNSYGYVRQWILDHFKILGLVELPRRIFLKSDADLRSNILFAQKTELTHDDYPIHAELVRKVGYKLGKGFFPIPARDSETGLEIRDDFNRAIIDSDFNRVKKNFRKFLELDEDVLTSWRGARVSDIRNHPTLDMKPRRLNIKALTNVQSIRKGTFLKLSDIAFVLDDTEEFAAKHAEGDSIHLIEGQDIRAVEGVVVLKGSEKRWQVEVRKTKKGYSVKTNDIIMGLVRPERRNIGFYLGEEAGVYASADGVAVIREKSSQYPIHWIFHALRTEACRLQLWTESGGTSYGKLTIDQIRNLLIPIPSSSEIEAIKFKVTDWAKFVSTSMRNFQEIWESNDKVAILNSPILGLEVDDLEVNAGEDSPQEE